MYKDVCSTYPAITGFPTQYTTKAIDNQINQLYQSVKLWQSVATQIDKLANQQIGKLSHHFLNVFSFGVCDGFGIADTQKNLRIDVIFSEFFA